jgi:hypothetical protein
MNQPIPPRERFRKSLVLLLHGVIALVLTGAGTDLKARKDS